MTSYPTPDEDPTPPPAPETPGAAPTGKWGVPPSTSPQLTPAGRSSAGGRAILWAGLAVLAAIIALLIVLAA